MKKCVVDGVEYVATLGLDGKDCCKGCVAKFDNSLCQSLDSCFEEDNDGVEAIWVRAE